MGNVEEEEENGKWHRVKSKSISHKAFVPNTCDCINSFAEIYSRFIKNEVKDEMKVKNIFMLQTRNLQLIFFSVANVFMSIYKSVSEVIKLSTIKAKWRNNDSFFMNRSIKS